MVIPFDLLQILSDFPAVHQVWDMDTYIVLSSTNVSIQDKRFMEFSFNEHPQAIISLLLFLIYYCFQNIIASCRLKRKVHFYHQEILKSVCRNSICYYQFLNMSGIILNGEKCLYWLHWILYYSLIILLIITLCMLSNKILNVCHLTWSKVCSFSDKL